MPKTMRKTSLKIQMLAGNSLNVCPDSDSQKKLPLVYLFEFDKNLVALLLNVQCLFQHYAQGARGTHLPFPAIHKR